jgi:hypothetical protein
MNKEIRMNGATGLRELMVQVADSVGATLEDRGDGEYSLEYPLDDERTQVVSAFVEQDAEGEDWVMAYSVFGRLEQLEPVDLLERTWGPGFTFIAVDEGDAMVCSSMPLQGLDGEMMEGLLGDVASWADTLEEELIGGDET